jgi:hypothetical protein
MRDAILPFYRLGAGAMAAVVLLATPLAAAAETLLVMRNATAGQQEVRLSEADLLALPQVTIRTHTEFTDGAVDFVGPLARDVLSLIAAGSAQTAHMVAANEYAVDIPIRDFADYDVIFALAANGQRLSLRDKGPIWVMYPLDDHTELQDPLYNIRLIWQLTAVELR